MNKFLLFATTAFLSCVLAIGFSDAAIFKSVHGNQRRMSFDTTAVKKEIAAANQQLMESLLKGDSIGVANCYTWDAKFMNPNAPAMVGRKNIEAEFAGFINAGVTNLSLTTISLWGNKDLMAEEGTFTIGTKD